MAQEPKQKYINWVEKEDNFLKDTVIEIVKKGGTQLQAFEEVSVHLKRTPSSVAFRWNSTLRKIYKDELEEAKKLAKVAKREAKKVLESASLTEIQPLDKKQQDSKKRKPAPKTGDIQEKQFINYDDVIKFIEEKRQIEEEYKELNKKFEELSTNYQQLKNSFNEVVSAVSKVDQTSID